MRPQIRLHRLRPQPNPASRNRDRNVPIRQHLSDLTGDPSHGSLAQRAESYFFNGEEVWPGLTGGNFPTETGEILDADGGWTSGTDSTTQVSDQDVCF